MLVQSLPEPGAPAPPRIIRLYRWTWRFWKQRRFRRFISCLNPQTSESLLDIGGYAFNWFQRGRVIGRVDVVNLDPVAETEAPEGSPVIRSLTGDGRRLTMANQSYDIVFSNSVIEHVGTFDDQKAFAAEARRLGSKLWIQTPARECPIEPHFIGFCIHWFPRRYHASLARWTSLRGLGGSSSTDDLRDIANTTRLLSKSEMRELFPDCTIWTERMFGFIPKSHVAIRRGD